MSILNVNQIQPVGSGQTITVSATNVDAGSATVTAGTFTGNLTGNVTSSSTSTFSSGLNVTGGDVGIGTDNPDYPFHLFNSGQNNIALFESGDAFATFGLSDSNGSVSFRTTLGKLEITTGGDAGTVGTNGIDALVIKSTGEVGIGTDNPSSKLHISTDDDNILTLSHGKGSGVFGSWITFAEGKETYKWSLGYHDTHNIFSLCKGSDIQQNRFISINDTTNELEIRTSANNSVNIVDYSASYRPSIVFAYSDSVSGVATETFKIRSEGSNGLDFYYGSTPTFAMRLDSNGNLGIGTNTIRDSSKLDVNGDLYVEGNSNLIKVCHLKTNVNASVTEGSGNAFTVDFNLQEYRDTDYFTHSNGIITVLKAGWYKITGNLVYQNADVSVRNTIRAYVLKNGSEITSTATYDYDRGSSYGEFSNNKIDTFLQLAADDTIAIGNYGYNIDGTVTIESAECEFIVTYFR